MPALFWHPQWESLLVIETSTGGFSRKSALCELDLSEPRFDSS